MFGGKRTRGKDQAFGVRHREVVVLGLVNVQRGGNSVVSYCRDGYRLSAWYSRLPVLYPLLFVRTTRLSLDLYI
jgi:hypothetical protein